MIVLFGGSGRVGSATVEALRALHMEAPDDRPTETGSDSATAPRPQRHIGVRVGPPFCRIVTRHPEMLDTGSGIEAFRGDLDDRQSIGRALSGATGVFLLSSVHPDMDRREISVLREARQEGVRRVVKVSGSEGLVGPGSRSLTMRQHFAAEEELKASGLEWAILRPSAYLQTTMEQIAPFVRDSHRFSLPGGSHRFAFIDTRDIGAVAAEILSTDTWWNQTHVLTGPEALSYSEVAAALSDLLGTTVTYRRQRLFFARLAINQQVGYHHARDQLADLAVLLEQGIEDRPTETVQNILGRPPCSVEQWIAEHRQLFG